MPDIILYNLYRLIEYLSIGNDVKKKSNLRKNNDILWRGEEYDIFNFINVL